MDNIAREATQKLIDKSKYEIDKLIIKGIAKKGYKFKNTKELLSFIEENCSSVDFKNKKQIVYYIKGKAFMVHNYRNNVTITDNKLEANLGTYKFI